MILETLERTDWIDCKILPVHVGWYEADYGLDQAPCMRYWDGAWWQMQIEAEDGIRMVPTITFGAGDNHQWRGLVVQPDCELLDRIMAESKEDDANPQQELPLEVEDEL